MTQPLVSIIILNYNAGQILLDCFESVIKTNYDNFEIPDSFEIISIYPNPFNPSTNISYTLDSIDNINITVFDTLGNEMETLFDGYQGIGYHDISWVPAHYIPSGSYFIKISTSNNSIINKVTYIK